MDDVSKEAKISKRTLYRYFNSKEQIYFEIMIKGFKLLIDMVDVGLKATNFSNAIDKIRQIGIIVYSFSNEYPNYFKAIMEYENGELDFNSSILNKSKEECYDLGEKLLCYLVDALKDGVRDGDIKSEIDIKSTSLVLWSSAVGLFSILRKKALYIKHYYNKDTEEMVNEAFKIYIDAIRKF